MFAWLSWIMRLRSAALMVTEAAAECVTDNEGAACALLKPSSTSDSSMVHGGLAQKLHSLLTIAVEDAVVASRAPRRSVASQNAARIQSKRSKGTTTHNSTRTHARSKRNDKTARVLLVVSLARPDIVEVAASALLSWSKGVTGCLCQGTDESFAGHQHSACLRHTSSSRSPDVWRPTSHLNVGTPTPQSTPGCNVPPAAVLQGKSDH